MDTIIIHFCSINYRIFQPIARALSIQKRSEIVKNEHARYTLERFLTDNVLHPWELVRILNLPSGVMMDPLDS
jgi:hypothetical protein